MLEDVTTRGEGVRGATELEEGRSLDARCCGSARPSAACSTAVIAPERFIATAQRTRGDVKGRGPIAARKRRAEEIEARRRTAHARSHDCPRVAELISREGDAATWSVRASGARASSDNLHEGTPSAELRRCVVT